VYSFLLVDHISMDYQLKLFVVEGCSQPERLAADGLRYYEEVVIL